MFGQINNNENFRSKKRFYPFETESKANLMIRRNLFIILIIIACFCNPDEK